MKFGDLNAGDVLDLAGQKAVLLAVEKPHPLNLSLNMYVWYIFNSNRLSFDMLDPEYELIPGSKVSRDGLASFRFAIDSIGHYSGQV